MAKKPADSGVYRVTEIIGTSTVSWEDATKKAIGVSAEFAIAVLAAMPPQNAEPGVRQ